MHGTAENGQSAADERVRGILRAVYGRMKHGAKTIMRDGGVCERTARALQNGDALPSTKVFIRLMASNSDVFESVCEAIGRIPRQIAPSEHELNQLRADVDDLKRRLDRVGS